MSVPSVEDVLKKAYADECEMVGNATLHEIATGVSHVEPRGGDKIPHKEIIEGLGVAATYIKIALEVYKIRKAAKDGSAAALVAEERGVRIPSAGKTDEIFHAIEDLHKG